MVITSREMNGVNHINELKQRRTAYNCTANAIDIGRIVNVYGAKGDIESDNK